MMSSQFSLLLRTCMIIAGGGGFLLGAGLGFFVGQTTLATALLRGAVLCVAAAWLTRFLLFALFRAYLVQLQNRRQKTDEEENQKK